MKTRSLLLALLLLTGVSCSVTRPRVSDTNEGLKNTITYLCSTELMGRAPGTVGDSLARVYIAGRMLDAGLRPFTGDGFQRFTLRAGFVPEGTDTIDFRRVQTANVAMYLEGSDPVLRNEYIIIGAHYDHLGMGGPASSSRRQDTIALHPGADDNASGVAVMLELAKRLAVISHARSIVFVAFAGEETGLTGSKHFVANMPVEAGKIDLMINLDMVGRMKEGNFLQVGGVGTAAGLRDSVMSLCDTTLIHLTLTDEGSGPSDHFSFYAESIPVLFLTTGTHEDYHLPADSGDKLNYEGMALTADLVYNIVTHLSGDSRKLAFRLSGAQVPQAMGRRGGVTLGIMPDVAGVVKNGLRADLVTPGKPAAMGGMKKGDVIVAIEGKPVNDIQEYMLRLSELKAGQKITVDVLREGKREILIIQL